MKASSPSVGDLIRLVSSAALAESLGYAGPNDAFRVFCNRIGVTQVPGRRGWYDPLLVRRRLDEAQGLIGEAKAAERAPSLVEKRRARRGAA